MVHFRAYFGPNISVYRAVFFGGGTLNRGGGTPSLSATALLIMLIYRLISIYQGIRSLYNGGVLGVHVVGV